VDFQNRHWLFPAIWKSLWRVMRSLLLVIMVGVPIGVIMGTFAPADAFLRKIVNGAKSLPTTGIVGLIVLWFSVEERAKIVFLFLGTVFYMIILVKNAILDVREDYLRVALDLGASRWQVISKVLLKAALPQIWDAIAVCNGIMWTYIVLAEFINSSEEQLGLGYLLFLGSRTGGSGKVYAMLLIIATISVLTDFMLRAFKKKYLDW
jgi:NitT/TauT family transport system permease protein